VKSPFTESNTSYLTNHPFGMVMPNRSWFAAGAVGYRFGFNGKEGDGEINGENNSYDFGARIYDSRLGRWWASDPKEGKYPALSPYHFGYNNPIITIDPDGEENIIVVGSDKTDTQGKKMKNKFINASIKFYTKFQKNNPNEKTTILVFVDPNSTSAQLEEIKSGYTKKGVLSEDVRFVTSSKDIITYINTRPTNMEIKKGPIGLPVLTFDSPDLVTDFVYIGHGYKNALLIDRPNGGKASIQSDGSDIYSVGITKAGATYASSYIAEGVFSENACSTLVTCRWEDATKNETVKADYNLGIGFSNVSTNSFATVASTNVRFDDDRAEFQNGGSVTFNAGKKSEVLSGQKDAFETGISGDNLNPAK